MFLKSIQPVNYGPFSSPTRLDLDPQVTVLTGANDTGKSSMLRLVYQLCTPSANRTVEENEFNCDNLHNASELSWDRRPDFGAEVTFDLVPGYSNPYVTPAFHFNGELSARFGIAPVSGFIELLGFKRTDGQAPMLVGNRILAMPEAILLPPPAEVGNIINLTEPKPLEQKLLRLAFGSTFTFSQLQSLSGAAYLLQLRHATVRLNDLLTKAFPHSSLLQFNLSSDMGKREHLAVQLCDAHQGMTPLGYRGAGVRRVLAVLTALLGSNFDKGVFYILFDEPEASLHADSQHMLRRILEALGERPNVQVIFATHSPSMINTMRPHALRLLKRDVVGDKATSIVINKPYEANYFPIRTSLGITPADSLLFAPVTIIVEGGSEVIGLPLLLCKLARANAPGFETAENLLSQVHILDGIGDNYPFACELAKSQGAKPIIFLDGDKKRHLKQHRMEEKHPDVPIITLDEGEEFEQLVPEETYFQALAEEVGQPPDNISPSVFHSWEEKHSLPAKMVFTKRIDRWLGELGLVLDKPQVMKRAIELVETPGIKTGQLRGLMERVKQLLGG
jgi:ABC-type transport system involved in cytochrome c biogenesis ATPase subunit